MGSLKQSYLLKLIKSILVISLILGSTVYGEQTFFHISSTVYGEGKVVPSQSVKVKEGNKKKLKFIGNAHYNVDSVVIDGINKGGIDNYTFENVSKDHDVFVWFSINKPETTVVLSKIHVIEQDTLNEIDIHVNVNFDTIITEITKEINTNYLITKIDSLSDDIIYLTICDTVISKDSIVLAILFDTLQYMPNIDTSMKVVMLTGRDTLTSEELFVDWNYDTIVTIISEEIVYDTAITITDIFRDSTLLSSTYDTLLSFWNMIISETIDTIKYIEPDDMTAIDYYSGKSLNLRTGFSAGPNPYTISQGNLMFVFNSVKPISEASIILYDKLGNMIGDLTVYNQEIDNSIVFEWDGITIEGEIVRTSSIIAVVRAELFDGSIEKTKILVGIKR